MSSWSYRVMRSEGGYGIHEVYDFDGKRVWTEEPEVWADSKEELRETLEAMLKATDAPTFVPRKKAGK